MSSETRQRPTVIGVRLSPDELKVAKEMAKDHHRTLPGLFRDLLAKVADRRELADRFANQEQTRLAAIDELADMLPEKPRTWSLPAEPGPEVTAVRDRYKRRWTRDRSLWVHSSRTCWYGWQYLLEHGPLTDATREEP